jgi:hypothetical protein
MGIQYKVLGQANPAATTWTPLLSLPTATQAILSTLSVCNFGSSPTTFSVAVCVANAAVSNTTLLYGTLTIPNNDTFLATMGITLGANDVVNVYAGNANLAFQVFGQEVS